VVPWYRLGLNSRPPKLFLSIMAGRGKDTCPRHSNLHQKKKKKKKSGAMATTPYVGNILCSFQVPRSNLLSCEHHEHSRIVFMIGVLMGHRRRKCHELNGRAATKVATRQRHGPGDEETTYHIRRTSLTVSFRSHTIFRRRNFS
jgi:hypothetical protein